MNDHFVSKTYLKHFGDSSKGGMLHAYRKKKGDYFLCRPENVCHEWDGDLNAAFLPHRPELLGDFRKMFEPRWNTALTSITSGRIADQERFIISACMANLMMCTPTMRRIGAVALAAELRSYMSFSKRMQEKHGGIPDLPITAIEMMERGIINVDIDPDWIKALGTRRFLEGTLVTYHHNWTILVNETSHPFVTSDNPIAWREAISLGAPAVRFFPITPKFCLSIMYVDTRAGEIDPEHVERDLTAPSKGVIKYQKVSKDRAKDINRLIVQGAEDMVFSSSASPEIAGMVKQYADYGLHVETVELPGSEQDTIYQASMIRVRERL